MNDDAVLRGHGDCMCELTVRNGELRDRLRVDFVRGSDAFEREHEAF